MHHPAVPIRMSVAAIRGSERGLGLALAHHVPKPWAQAAGGSARLAEGSAPRRRRAWEVMFENWEGDSPRLT
jgi:hypothetical protein